MPRIRRHGIYFLLFDVPGPHAASPRSRVFISPSPPVHANCPHATSPMYYLSLVSLLALSKSKVIQSYMIVLVGKLIG